MKRSRPTVKLAKLIRKKNKKLRKYFKKLSKLVRKKNKNIHRYFKMLSKKRTKITRKLVRSAQKKNKKLRKYFKALPKKKISAIGSLILLLVIVASVGIVYAEKASNKKPDTTPKTHQLITKTPDTTAKLGPSQSNTLFSTYPSWAQDFATDTSSTLNSNDWEVAQGPAQNSNQEAEYYTDSSTNLRVQNGALTLEATQQPEPGGLNYASARIDTDNKVSFLYGRINITAKIPDSVGTWPAIWFLPANNKYEDLSPTSDSTRYENGGEIDLDEQVGWQPNDVYGIVHTLSDYQNNPGGSGSFNTITIPDNNTTYNEYSLLWTPTSITFEINNVPFYTYSRQASATYMTWPFDQPFYLIMNLAIGGTWGGQDTSQFKNGIDNSALPASMDISSIYYYSYVGNTTTN